MKTTSQKLFIIIGIILSGFIVVAYITINNSKEMAQQIEENEVPFSKAYNAGSVSEGTILVLLAIGVIGALVISRKKKDISSIAQRNKSPVGPENQSFNKDRAEL